MLVYCTLAQIGADWSNMVQIGELGGVCCTLVHFGANLVQFGADFCSLVQLGEDWCSLVQLSADWCNLVQIGAVWCNLGQIGAVSCSLV